VANIPKVSVKKKAVKKKESGKSNKEVILPMPLNNREKLREEILTESIHVEQIEGKNNIINLLLDMQEREGYLSRGSMIKLSKDKNIPGVNLSGVATFYAQFKLTPRGKYVISLCRGTACHVKNSELIIEYLEETLGIKKGQTTKDNKFTLETVNCIGACAKAPAMMINGTVYGELTKTKVKKIIDELK
jgi:NADH:ubiquinone oxidoreductase subunit E